MITDKSRYGHDAVLDLNCGDSVQVLRTEPMTLTEQEQKIVQKYLGIALLEKSYIDANGHLMVVLSDGRTLDVGSARGLSGATPYLGENGNWFVEGVDTLQSARGLPGFTPYIGENEHWWIDETDTGVPARGIPLTEKADNTRFLRNDGTWQKVTPENIGAAKQSVVADHESRIEALEQRTVTAPYYTDGSVAYIKEVPENALPFASVDMVGGMTRKCTNVYSGGDLEFTKSKSVVCSIKAGTYTISADVNSSFGQTVCLVVFDSVENTNIVVGTDRPTVVTLLNDVTRIVFWAANTTANSEGQTATFKNIMINEGDTALPYEPYFDGLRSAPVTEVESVGVNLLPYPFYETTKTHYGVTFKDDGKGCITVSGTATGAATFFLVNKEPLPQKPFYINANRKDTKNVRIVFILFDDTMKQLHSMNVYSGARVNPNDYPTARYYRMTLNRDNDGVVAGTFTPSINYGTTALPYEPYRSDTLPIPAEVQALDGYGWGINADCYNYIDLEKKRFVKRVGCVDMGTLTWEKSTSVEGRFHAIVSGIMVVGRDTNVISAKYDTSTKEENGTMFHGSDRVYIRDTSYTDAATFNSAMSGVMLYYELAEPVITDISDILPDDNLIGVEGGGTITMVNEYGYAVPSEITYARLTWQ